MEGILHITVVEGKNFAPRDKTGFSDPYCVITVNGNKHDSTTKVINQTNNPKFDETFRIKIINSHEVKYEKRGEVIVDVWDWDRLSVDDFVGRAIIPMTEISEDIKQAWYPLVAKPHFHDPVTGDILLKHKIEWRALPVQNLSSISRVQQKVGAKLSQLSRVGADILGKKVDNLVSWSSRTRQLWSHINHIKPPKFTFCAEIAHKYKESTAFDKEELELLFYAFRSFCYPDEQINRQKFCRVFPALEGNDIIYALFNAFNLDPQDDISFGEFVQSLSHVTRGNQYQRLHMVSRFYEQHGAVGRARFIILTKAIIKLLVAPYSEEEQNALVKQIFGEQETISLSKFMVHLHTMDLKTEDLDGAEETLYAIGNCFGLFHYLYETTIELIEQMVNGAHVKPEKEGFLLKKSGSSWAKYWFVLRDGFIYYYRDPSEEFPARVVFLEVDSNVDNAPDFELLDEYTDSHGRPRSNSKSRQRASSSFAPTPSTTFGMYHGSLTPSPSLNLAIMPSSLSHSASTSSVPSSTTTPRSLASSLTISGESEFGVTLPALAPLSGGENPQEVATHAEGTAHINAANTSTHTNAAKTAASLSTPNPAAATTAARNASVECAATVAAALEAASALLAASNAAAATAQTGSPADAMNAAQIASAVASAYASAAQAAAAAAASAAVAWGAARGAELAIASIPAPPPLPLKPLVTSPPPGVRRFVALKKETVPAARLKNSPSQTVPEPTAISPREKATDSKSTPLSSTSATSPREKTNEVKPLPLSSSSSGTTTPRGLTESKSAPISSAPSPRGSTDPKSPPVSSTPSPRGATDSKSPPVSSTPSPRDKVAAAPAPVAKPAASSAPASTAAAAPASAKAPAPASTAAAAPASAKAPAPASTAAAATASTPASTPVSAAASTPAPTPAPAPVPTLARELSIVAAYTVIPDEPVPPTPPASIPPPPATPPPQPRNVGLRRTTKTDRLISNKPAKTLGSKSAPAHTPTAGAKGQPEKEQEKDKEKEKEKAKAKTDKEKEEKEKHKKNEHFVATRENTIKLRAGPYTMILAAKNEKHKDKWMERIYQHTSADINNAYGSFAPPRPCSGAEFFVDGHDYYRAVEAAIKEAREQIFITDWFLSPEVYLNRDSESGAMTSRLDHLLKEKAKGGVKIYIIVWNETKLAMNLNSERVKSVLESADRNITVICHPIMMMKWSHHQKTVIVDQDVAFLGGLDLCFGRYDTQAHNLEDATAKVFPGKDYYNPSRGGEFDGLENPFKDLVARARVPRMPWHDVSVKVEGYPARDVAKNFIQRWNHHRDQIQMSSRLLTPKSTLWPYRDTKTCQILRSIAEWSGQGCNSTESSIHTAMVHTILEAKHFIYIENQYFISNSAGGKVKNEIASALIQRIRKAIFEKKIRSLAYPNFRVIVLLPVHPEGTYKDSIAIRYIMKWQYNTINRGGSSILEVLQKEFPEENLSQYISFHAVRNYGILEGMVVTEQIYVHTKLMIVDDKRVIVGSANINDRSLAGDRDSEIAVCIDDEELVPSKMAGRPYMAGKFALNLRLSLWREHLGLAEEESKTIMDPVLPESFELLWQLTARNNTALYTQVFGIVEGDTVEKVRDIAHQRKPLATPETLAILKQIRGHLVDYPLNFLKTVLQESFASVDILVAGDEVFQ